MEGLIDAVEVVRRVVVRVRRAVEVVQRLRSVLLGLEQVVEGQPQLLAEVLDVEVVAVYELAAVLRDLSVCEHSPDRPAPPAEPVRGLVDVRQHTCLTEPVGGREPGESRADHDDLAGRRPAGRSRSARRAEREPEGGGTCGAEELAAGRVRVRGDVLEAGSERCAGHGSTITRCTSPALQFRSDTFEIFFHAASRVHLQRSSPPFHGSALTLRSTSVKWRQQKGFGCPRPRIIGVWVCGQFCSRVAAVGEPRPRQLAVRESSDA